MFFTIISKCSEETPAGVIFPHCKQYIASLWNLPITPRAFGGTGNVNLGKTFWNISSCTKKIGRTK